MVRPSLYVTSSRPTLNLLSPRSSQASTRLRLVGWISLRCSREPDQFDVCTSNYCVNLFALHQDGYFNNWQQLSDPEPPPVLDSGCADFGNRDLTKLLLNIAHQNIAPRLLPLCDRPDTAMLFLVIFCSRYAVSCHFLVTQLPPASYQLLPIVTAVRYHYVIILLPPRS